MFKIKNKKIWRQTRLWLIDKSPIFIVSGMIFTIVSVFFIDNIFVTIKSGEAGVLYRRLTTGTETDYVYPEKIHFILPWNKMYIYSVRVQTIKHELTVLTNKGLPITLKLAIRFHPEYEMLGILHKKVGEDYVNRILLPQIESVLRKQLGALDPENIYTNKEGVLTKILWLAMEETMRNYIIVEDIIIRSIELPKPVKEAIANKLVEQQKLQAYEYTLQTARKEAEKKAIEAEGIKNYQQIITQTLSDKLIKWQAVQATKGLAESQNSKIVIIGAGEEGLPVILGNSK